MSAEINLTLASSRSFNFGSLEAPLPLPPLLISSPSQVSATIINKSSIAITLSPVSYNRFTTTTIQVTIPASAFYCQGKSVDVTVRVIVSGSPLPIAMGTAVAFAKSSSVTAMASSSPTAAVASARVSMLQYLLSCQFDPTDITYGNSLTGYRFGPKRGAPVRGAVIGNLLLFLGFALLLSAFCAVVAAITSFRLGSSFRHNFWQMTAVFHFPSVLMMPALAVMQPTVSAACTLLVYNPPMAPYDPQVAAWALVLIASFCVWVTYVLVFCFSCELAVRQGGNNDRDEESKAPSKPSAFLVGRVLRWCQQSVVRFMGSRSHWEAVRGRGGGRGGEGGGGYEDQAAREWKQRMLFFFADVKVPSYAVLDMWMAVILGVTSGLVSPQQWVCTAQLAASATGYAVLLLALLYLRPGLSLYTQSYLLVTNVLGVLSSAANIWASKTSPASSRAASMGILCSLLISVTSLAKSLVDALVLMSALPTLLRRSKEHLTRLAAVEAQQKKEPLGRKMRSEGGEGEKGVRASSDDGLSKSAAAAASMTSTAHLVSSGGDPSVIQGHHQQYEQSSDMPLGLPTAGAFLSDDDQLIINLLLGDSGGGGGEHDDKSGLPQLLSMNPPLLEDSPRGVVGQSANAKAVDGSEGEVKVNPFSSPGAPATSAHTQKSTKDLSAKGKADAALRLLFSESSLTRGEKGQQQLSDDAVLDQLLDGRLEATSSFFPPPAVQGQEKEEDEVELFDLLLPGSPKKPANLLPTGTGALQRQFGV